jgi:hypothetical protein
MENEKKFDHRGGKEPMFDRLAWRRECYERYLGLNDEEEVGDEQAAAIVTANAMTSVTPMTGSVALGQRRAPA